ncbi:DUF1800 domain-containing protein [Sphingorhabdus pulchriflava]|uniref:DUF1800 domain-containing protein n=1 Tax=Sphingorhabdus pulchriflava TaxID=2292257 RepID=A0A371B6F6_9SPHN|nr:DUF1800 domain-containing protein [Sphingorhabdus pulchriflava]RDV02981.1 DUF1800 domain-containing protein [Sphingorhabdus pulchriflava]
MAVDAAIALNRFGLGAIPGIPVAANPKYSLLDQLEKFDSTPTPIGALPPSRELVLAVRELGMERRERKSKAATQDAQAETAEKQLNGYRKAVRDQYVKAVDARMGVALASTNSFAERLVHFWANHFALSIDKIAIVGLAGSFEFEAIRPHILGNLADLLRASTWHPAMLLYLDQAQSIGPNSPLAKRVGARSNREIGLNENLAREILELHTLGDRSAYSQADVTEFARAMTGLTVGGLGRARIQRLVGSDAKPGEAIFVEALHEPGTRRIVGRTYAQNGAKALSAIISDLARHPATARHIAIKLARHFIADDPPASLVAKLEANFLKTGGDLPALYRTLVEAPESWVPQQAKFKSPWEWTISALRALSITAIPGKAQAAVALFNQMGQPVWKPGSPKGYGDITADWAGPAGLMRRVETAGRFAKLAANRVDARTLATAILPGSMTATTAEHIARAESPEQGLALLLVSPEFLRR